MKVLKRAGTVVISVLLWAVILIAALYAFTTMATRDNQNVANLFGYTPLVVKSDSMAPVFETGDLILIKKCDPSTLKVGDIICFHTTEIARTGFILGEFKGFIILLIYFDNYIHLLAK